MGGRFKTKKHGSHYSRSLGRRLEAAEAWSESLVVGGKAQGQLPKTDNRRSIGLIVGVVALIGGLLLIQLFNLTIVQGSRYIGLADGNRLREQITYAPRGRILDSNGVVLADNTASFQLVVYPYLLPKNQITRNQVYSTIADGLNLSAEAVSAPVQTAGLDNVQPILIKDNIDYRTALILDQKLPNLPGFSLDAVPIRVYKTGSTLANVLGYVGRADLADLKANPGLSPVDFVGKDGIEAQYDQILRGQNGDVETEVDAAGRPVRTIREVPVKPGPDIKLTINAGLQQVFATAIQTQMQVAHVDRAAGVALDPNTGAILAMVNYPTYDDNLFATNSNPKAISQLFKDASEPLLNRVISGEYPSGSIIKPMELSGALQEGVVTPETTIVDAGKIVVPSIYDPNTQYVFNGWVPTGLGPMDAVRAIAMSSDIYFYEVGGGYKNFKGMGVDRLDKYYKLFGFGKQTGIDLPGEQAGLVPSPAWKKQTTGQDWVLGDTYHLAIGQGDFLVTPLQMAVATAAVANNGSLVQPHLFEETADGKNVSKTTVTRTNFIDQAHLAIVREGMREVIANGSTNPATFSHVGVVVAGKSGTAEVGFENKEVPHAWYEAFAPFNNPQIVFAVILEHGEGGSAFAAPAIATSMQWYFSAQH